MSKCAYCNNNAEQGRLFCEECKRNFPTNTRENKLHPAELLGIPDMKKFWNSLLIEED